MSVFSEAIAAAKSCLFSIHGEQVAYNGTDIVALIEDGFERVENSVASVAFYIRIQQSDVSNPAVGDVVTYGGVQYRTGEGISPSSGDWIIPIIRDYIEV